MDQILNRGGFDYTFDADPLYHQYSDQYTRSARLARQDAQAEAAAATGGYGSSYAASAGSQAYQQQMAEMDSVLPQLYSTALQRWNAEGKAQQEALSALTGLEQNARDEYQAAVDRYYSGLQQYTKAANDAYDKDYKAFADRQSALTDLRDYYAGQEQQAVKNAQSQAEYELAVKKYEDNMRKWQAELEAQREKWQAQLARQQAEFEQEMALQRQKLAAAAQSSAKSTGSGASSQPAAQPAGQPVTLSAGARQVQQTVNQYAAALAGRVGTGGLNQAERSRNIQQLLKRYCNQGAITKEEANLIGRPWNAFL